MHAYRHEEEKKKKMLYVSITTTNLPSHVIERMQARKAFKYLCL